MVTIRWRTRLLWQDSTFTGGLKQCAHSPVRRKTLYWPSWIRLVANVLEKERPSIVVCLFFSYYYKSADQCQWNLYYKWWRIWVRRKLGRELLHHRSNGEVRRIFGLKILYGLCFYDERRHILRNSRLFCGSCLPFSPQYCSMVSGMLAQRDQQRHWLLI